jgi:hypothetical protein
VALVIWGSPFLIRHGVSTPRMLLDISPAGDIVAVGHEESVHVIDAADGTVLTSLAEPDAYVRFVSSSSSLLTGSNPSWGPPAIRLRDAG